MEQHPHFQCMGGLEVSSTDRKSIGWEGWGFVYDNGGVPSLDYKLFKQQIEEGHTYYAISPSYRRSFAAFANATYSYKARYVLNGTIRYEGTTSWVCRATHAGCQRGTCQAHGTHTRKASSERKLTQKCFHTQQPCVILTYSRQRTIKHLQRHTYLYIRNGMASVGIRPRAYA